MKESLSEGGNTGRMDEILDRVRGVDQVLFQDTEDTAQLNPYERLISIQKVWTTCRSELGDVHTAIDAGSGFGYGVVFLSTEGIAVVGVENVGKKIEQGIELFKKIDFNIQRTGEIDFTRAPAIVEGDFSQVQTKEPADLICMFYLSLKMINDDSTLESCRRLLKSGGKVLLSTQAPAEQVKAWLQNKEISFPYKIVEVHDNFERTAIILG